MPHVLVGQKRSKQINSKARHKARIKAGTHHAYPSAIFAVGWLNVGLFTVKFQINVDKFSGVTQKDMEFEGLAHLVQALSELTVSGHQRRQLLK